MRPVTNRRNVLGNIRGQNLGTVLRQLTAGAIRSINDAVTLCYKTKLRYENADHFEQLCVEP